MPEENGEYVRSGVEQRRPWTAAHPYLAAVLTFLGILVVCLIIFMIGFPNEFPSWTGVGQTMDKTTGELLREEKTLWDWLELLIVPVFLALAIYLLNRSARINDREIAEKARETDRIIAKEREEQSTLENYYDQMAGLLLSHNLQPKSEIYKAQSILRARTLTVLHTVNADRKGQIVRFLYEAKLIDRSKPVIVLKGADLREADLRHAYLTEADLSGADLTAADLSGANLMGINLNRGKLINAKLHKTDLRGRVDHLGHELGPESDLSWVDLSGADLSDTKLSRTNFTAAIYTVATKWPKGFNPDAAGVSLVDRERNPVKKEANDGVGALM